jgi:hypothetical protein
LLRLYDGKMSRDRRPARSDVPRRTPGELVDALRDLAADAEEPVLSARRRFLRPPAVSEPAAAPPDMPAPQTTPPVADTPDVDAPADRFDDRDERDADDADVLWRRPAPARARRPPGRAALGRRSSTGAGRRRAGFSPLRLGAGVLGVAVIVIVIASALSGGSTKKPASHHAAKASPSLPATTLTSPAALAPKPIRHRATPARHPKRAHRATPARHPKRARRSASHRHRHRQRRVRATHKTVKHHKHRTRARRHRRPRGR